MFKFLNRSLYFRVINSWIRDGSNLESFGSYADGEWVVLRGKDGAREEFYLCYTEEEYNDADNFTAWTND